MVKRKHAKSGKGSKRRKGARKAKPSAAPPVVESALFTAPDPAPPFTMPPRAIVTQPQALTPKPALPVSGRTKREGETRGGKSTLSTHEFLAEVPAPPKPKPAPRAKAPKPPQAKPPQPKATQPAPPQPKSSAPRSTSPPQRARPPAKVPEKPRATPRVSSPAPNAELSMAQIYETLAALLVPYARKMESEMHPKIGFCLKAKSARTGRETHFGAVQALPDGVAYHLFPLYGHPDLLENVSPELFNRLRGKTCFHFDSLHAGLVAELAQLTHAGFERFLSDGVF